MEKQLLEIKRNCAILKQVLREVNNSKKYRNWIKLELTYTSNAISGNPLLRNEVQRVIEEGKVSGTRFLNDWIEVVNHARAIDYIFKIISSNNEINEKVILNIHKILVTGLEESFPGEYRKYRIKNPYSEASLPNPVRVPSVMPSFYKWLEENINDEPLTAIMLPLKLLEIHPFTSKNGRMARLLMNLLLLKNNYTPIVIRPTDKKLYMNAIEKYQTTGDAKKYIKLMLKLLNRTTEFIINMLKFDPNAPIKLVTVSQYAKILGIPAAEVRKSIKRGALIPTGYSNVGHMLFEVET